jgi:hypothetical protein
MAPSTAASVVWLGVGSGASVAGGSGTFAASFMRAAGDAVRGLGEGLDSLVVAGDTWMAVYIAIA